MGLNLVTKTPGMEALDQLFRIGNGPSSSHSMGPTRASEIFLARNEKAARFRVTLYGSLSATGRGHFTDQAIADILGADRTEIVWSEEVKPFHPNGMELEAFSADGTRLERWLCYSIGGGKISDETAEVKVVKIYALDTMDKLLAWCKETGRHLWEYFAEVEGEAGWDYLRVVWQQMQATIEHGLHCDGVLPGGLNLPRKARSLHLLARKLNAASQRTCLIAAYAYASNEDLVSFDRTIEVMLATGRDLPAIYRETSHGGLAASWRKMC